MATSSFRSPQTVHNKDTRPWRKGKLLAVLSLCAAAGIGAAGPGRGQEPHRALARAAESAPKTTVHAVDFSWSPGAPKVGETVHFTDLSTGSPSRWSWDFGDGGLSSLQNPNHTFLAAGPKTVSLAVTTSLGLSSVSKTVEVQASQTQPCIEGAEVLCLANDRFKVEVEWYDQYNDRDGTGQAVPSTDRTGFVWFFNQNNIELVVKVLDGTSLNGYFWVFYGALSDIEYWVTVTDTQTGSQKTYHNVEYNICGSGDTEAFPSTAKGSREGPDAARETLGQWAGGGWLEELSAAQQATPDGGLEGRRRAVSGNVVGAQRVRRSAVREEEIGPWRPRRPARATRRETAMSTARAVMQEETGFDERAPDRGDRGAQDRRDGAKAATKTRSTSNLYCEYLGSPLNQYHGQSPAVYIILWSEELGRNLTSGEFSYSYNSQSSTFILDAPEGEHYLKLFVDADGDGYQVGPWDLAWKNYRTLPVDADQWFARMVPLTEPVSSYVEYEKGACDNPGVTVSPGVNRVAWGQFPEQWTVEEVMVYVDQESCSTAAEDYQQFEYGPTATHADVELWSDAGVRTGVDISGASDIYGSPVIIGISYTYFTIQGSRYFGTGARVRTSAGGAAPTAIFGYDPAFPVVGETVQFTDLSQGSPTSWSWSFGDGGTSSAKNPTHVFNSPGSYEVSLTVSNAYGSSSSTQDVAIQSSGGQATCGNAFYDDGVGVTAYWFGGGMAGDRDHMYAVFFDLSDFGYTAGETEITGFCAGNSVAFAGGPWTNEVFIYPDDGGAPDDSVVLGQGTIETGDGTGEYTVQLAAPVPLNGDFWLVNRGDPKHEGEDFNMEADGSLATGHSFLSSTGISGLDPIGEGNFILRATLRTAAAPVPTAAFTFAPDQPKVGEEVQFTDTSTGSPTYWRWKFGDGGTSTARNPKHTYSTTGTKTVRLTAGNAYGEDTASATIDVRDFAQCQAGSETLCLMSNRFKVEVEWRSQYNAQEGVGHAITGSDKTGYMWFFNQSNIELLVKVLNGTALNGHYWVFYGALSDVEYWIHITDMQTGQKKTYYNEPYNICGVGDTTAF